MKTKIFAFLVCIAIGSGVYAQSVSPEVIAVAGDEATISATKVSWTIGEALIETNTGSGFAITQGFHQPAYVLVAIDEATSSNYAVKVFPNPVNDLIFIDIEREEDVPMRIVLVDMSGKILLTQTTEIQQGRISLDLSKLALGNYFLRITNETSTFMKSFKLQKVL